jgi:hypothetical protein
MMVHQVQKQTDCWHFHPLSIDNQYLYIYFQIEHSSQNTIYSFVFYDMFRQFLAIIRQISQQHKSKSTYRKACGGMPFYVCFYMYVAVKSV